MPAKRFQKISRISVEKVLQEVSSRNHSLIEYTVGKKDNLIIPKSSNVVLFCNNCGYEWETRLGVYLKCGTNLSGGCRGCYNKNVVNPEIYPNSPCIPNETIENRPKRREGIEKLRDAHRKGQYGFIQNKEDLIQYLEQNPNAHNTFVLELIQRESNMVREKQVLSEPTSKHHILPIFDQGSPDSWNILEVTRKEHMQIHMLRYEVYKKEGDKKAIYGTTSDFQRSSSDSFDESSQSERVSVNWGVVRRTPEVSFAIKTGMIWKHKDGFVCKLKPNSVETVKEIIEKLIDCLPKDHPDRFRLQAHSSVANYIRQHIATIFPVPGIAQHPKLRKGAYNFVVAPYSGDLF